MKPSFALTLNDDGIGLLHRTPNGWLSIGSVRFDDPDLEEALAYLRRTALGLEPEGFATKLVLPNEQILYTVLHAPGPNAALRRAQIAAGLEGRTPYRLDELVFDWSGTGEDVQVAAIARGTLAEAEAFATEHRFNPVSFVALPESGGFAAEPWFGQTEAAATLLAEGDKVVRDQDPIRIIQRPAPAKAAQPEPVEEEPAAVAAEAPPEPEEVIAPTDVQLPEQEPEPEVIAAAPEPVAAPVLEPVAQVQADDIPKAKTAPVEPTPTAPAPAEAPEVRPQVAARLAASLANQTAAVPAEEPVAEEPSQTLSWPGEDENDPLAEAKAALAASLAPAQTEAEAALVAGIRKDLSPLAAVKPAPAAPARAAKPVAEAKSLSLSDKMQKALGKAARTPKAKAKAQRPAKAPAPPPLPPSASAQVALPQPSTEADAMTVFGQRGGRVGGKPRYLGLALVGLLLLVLLAVAVWAATYLDPQQAAVQQPATAEATAETADAGTPESVPPAEVAGKTEEPASAPTTATQAPLRLAAEEAQNPATIEALTLPLPDPALAAAPQARLAAATAADGDAAPTPAGNLPEFGALYQFDAAGNILPTPEGVMTPDGVMLVTGRPARMPPARPAPPPTAEPDPPVAATSAPDLPAAPAATPGAIAILPAAPTQEQDTTPAATFTPDATFAGNRPQRGPQALAPPVATDGPVVPAATEEEGALPVEETTATEFVSRRPPARPRTVAAAAEAAEAERTRQLAEASAAAAQAASLAAAEATQLAQAPTRRPAARPASIARNAQVAAATAAAAQVARIAPPAAAATNTARPSDEDDGEPEVTRAAPNIPTRASVARQATVTRAINLGRINLIGVSGTANSRQALVRESGGRMVRVKVGDRLDGGQVTAISQSELRYQKRGQTVSLSMPRS